MSAPEDNKDMMEEQGDQEPVEAPEVASDAPAAPEDSASEELNLGQERVLEFISYVVVNLVEHPEDVTVDVVRRQGRDVYQVRVHQDDLGKVIGKGGQTARAMRVMLTAVSARTDQRIGLEIVE
nr:KH domain-containing protein [Candidatus Krumholzibacteria bacterium]